MSMVQDLDCLGLPRREREAVRYAGSLYEEKFGRDPSEDPNLFLNLSDNPKTYLSWSATSGRLPTFRTNSTRFYNFQREQWMTSRDRLAALGLPVTPSTALAMGVPTLPVPWRCVPWTEHVQNGWNCRLETQTGLVWSILSVTEISIPDIYPLVFLLWLAHFNSSLFSSESKAVVSYMYFSLPRYKMMHGPARSVETPSTSRARRWCRWSQCPATGLRLPELGRGGI